MILLCPPEKSTQFHYPLDPKKIRTEGSMHKDTTYQGSDRQRLLPTRKKILKRKSTYFPTGFLIGQPSNKTAISSLCRGVYAKKKRVCHEFLNIKSEKNILSSRNYSSELEDILANVFLSMVGAIL